PCSMLTETRLYPWPTLGRPLFRFTCFHWFLSAGVKGRDWSATNGSSNCLVASLSSCVVISQYGCCFISSRGEVAASPVRSKAGRESRRPSRPDPGRRSPGGNALPCRAPIPTTCHRRSFSDTDYGHRE